MTNKQNKNKNKQKKKQPQVGTQQMIQSAVRAALKTVPQKNTFLGDIGQFAGNGISKIFGLGAYKMTRNSLYDSTTGAQVPFMHSSSESIIFRHREYIGDITSTTAFLNRPFAVNPGLGGTFPYLSTLAAAFQEYKFRGLIFEFKSTGATALVSGTNTAMGTISMVAQYRADAPPPNNKQEVLNQMWAVDGKTSESFILPIECAPKENPMAVQYIRSGEGFTGDVKMYDLCTLHVSSVGSQGSNIVGELWASYEVEFFKPRMSDVGGVLGSSHFIRSGIGGTTPFGTISVSTPTNTLGVVVGTNTITLPPNTAGRFLITVTHVGAATAWTAPAPVPTNCTLVLCWNNQTSNYISSPQNGVSATVVVYEFVIDAVPLGDSASPTITITGGVYPTGSTIDVVVTEVYDDYL
jgi:hypothetical protein